MNYLTETSCSMKELTYKILETLCKYLALYHHLHTKNHGVNQWLCLKNVILCWLNFAILNSLFLWSLLYFRWNIKRFGFFSMSEMEATVCLKYLFFNEDIPTISLSQIKFLLPINILPYMDLIVGHTATKLSKCCFKSQLKINRTVKL